jgi:hypothetical protein
MANIPAEWIQKCTDSSNDAIEYVSVDKYWNQIFSTTTSIGAPQYLVLNKLVKCLLSLSHGNSDVERGFSENNNIVSEDHSFLSKSSINGLRATNAGIKFFGDGKVHMLSIDLIYSRFFILFLRCEQHRFCFQTFVKHIHVIRRTMNNNKNCLKMVMRRMENELVM